MTTPKRETIEVVAPEGFSYVGWQRVVVRIVDNQRDISHEAADKLNAQPFDDDFLVFKGIAEGSHCLFIKSGESFGLADLADLLGELFDCDTKVIE